MKVKNSIVALAAFIFAFFNYANAQEKSVNMLLNEGIGPVILGKTFDELPDKASGLYDKKVNENSDMVLYSFLLDGETVIVTNGDGSIELIEVFPNLPGVATEDGIYVGMPESEMQNKPGWTKNEDSYVNGNITVWIQDGEVAYFQIGSYEEEI